jgi:hypothetical protein
MSGRPETVTYEDLQRWSEKIDNDPLMDANLAQNPIIREVCYAGQWLVDRLTELDCPDHVIGRIMYTAGRICFGRKDPWIVHQNILTQFANGTLEYEEEPEDNRN